MEKSNEVFGSNQKHSNHETHTHGEGHHQAHGHGRGSSSSSGAVYQCPMKCEGDKTYASPGLCPVCNMHLAPLG